MVSIVVAINFSARKDYTDDDSLKYAPTDTRFVSYSNTFCNGLDLSSDEYDIAAGYTAKLFMLSSSPELTGHESFSFSKTISKGFDEFYYIYFYMYPGSKLTVSACLDDFTGSTTFYLIKGNKNFKRWKDYPYTTKNMGQFDVVLCGNSGANKNYSYSIHSEDHYYMIFDFIYSTTVHMQMTFYRTRYEITNNGSIVDACSISTNQLLPRCFVTVPLSGEIAFLVVEPIDYQNFDWSDGVQLDVSCQPRVWVYVVISLACLIGGIALMVAIGICVCVCVWKSKKKKHVTLSTETNNMITSSAPDLDSSPLISDPVPPPINPAFEPASYGSNFEVPPMYKP